MTPAIIAEKFKEKMLFDLKFSENLSFLQIATVAPKNNTITPKLRTVFFRYDDHSSYFQFDCSTHTQKWQQLLALPMLSGVYLNTENFTQYRFEARVELISIEQQNCSELFNTHWLRTRPDLRKVLWQEYLKINSKKLDFNVDQPCPLFGTVLVHPYYWDIFTLDRQDFSQSMRCQMILENNHWKVYDNVSNIHPLELISDE